MLARFFLPPCPHLSSRNSVMFTSGSFSGSCLPALLLPNIAKVSLAAYSSGSITNTISRIAIDSIYTQSAWFSRASFHVHLRVIPTPCTDQSGTRKQASPQRAPADMSLHRLLPIELFDLIQPRATSLYRKSTRKRDFTIRSRISIFMYLCHTAQPRSSLCWSAIQVR